MERAPRAVRRISTAGLLGLAVGSGFGAAAGPVEGRVIRVPVTGAAEEASIDVTVFRPGGAGPFPLLALSHGSPRSAEELRRIGAFARP